MTRVFSCFTLSILKNFLFGQFDSHFQSFHVQHKQFVNLKKLALRGFLNNSIFSINSIDYFNPNSFLLQLFLSQNGVEGERSALF